MQSSDVSRRRGGKRSRQPCLQVTRVTARRISRPAQLGTGLDNPPKIARSSRPLPLADRLKKSLVSLLEMAPMQLEEMLGKIGSMGVGGAAHCEGGPRLSHNLRGDGGQGPAQSFANTSASVVLPPPVA